MIEPSRAEITRSVASLLAAESWEEKKRLVEEQRELLLTQSADQAFASLLEQKRGDADASRLLEEHRELVVRCRDEGIELAFAGFLLPTELEVLLAESVRLTQPGELPRKIAVCKAALLLVDRTKEQQQWASLQNLLADSLIKNPLGERAENLEQAIAHCEQALTVYTQEAFPKDWAKTQLNLADVYRNRIQGERADNLEQAISHCEQALTVYTQDTFPQDWARTLNTLALAYSLRIRGERVENIELAISHCQLALEVFTWETFPQDWARTLNTLALAYSLRIRGERADNLELSISYCQQVLAVQMREALHQQLAMTQNNLANAYKDRIRGERADNLEQAISYYQQALSVYTREAFPQQWAMTQYNLAIVYTDRVRGERAENIEQAISYYQQVLTVVMSETFPQQWAITQYSLAIAYTDRIRGERAENIEQAILHYQQALEVYTRQAFPEDWAGTENNLAIAYRNRIRGEHADNLEQAIFHFHQALEVYTPMTFPQNCRNTAYSLGYLLYGERRFSEARQALSIAHQAVEALRGEVQRDIAKRSVAEENADLYSRIVSCCLREEDEDAAFKYVVAGKGRAFVDQLASIRLDPSALEAEDPALAENLRTDRDLRQQIDTLRNTLLDNGGSSGASFSPDPDAISAQLATLLQQAASHWEEMTYKYPALTSTQQAPTLSAEQACALADELGATLVEYYCHAEGWCAFVVTSRDVHYIPLPLVNDDLLAHMVNWVQQVESPSGIGRNPLSYRRLSAWYEAVLAPLHASLPPDRPLILAPFGLLHLLPLAAARHPQTGRYVAEDYRLAFAPSLAALRTVSKQARSTGDARSAAMQRLLNVAYPGTPDSAHHLPNVLPEAQAIAAYFPQVTPLYQEAATPDAIVAHSHAQDAVHFGCHGWFDAERPEESGLLLAGGMLSVQRIINELRLNRVRLATLGACQSGRAALQSGDEHIGLLQAMLTTGVQAVVASLWKVDDDATHALFAAFYARLVAGYSPAVALQEAARLVREHPEHPHWAHPYYWAAFQVSGLALDAQKPT